MHSDAGRTKLSKGYWPPHQILIDFEPSVALGFFFLAR